MFFWFSFYWLADGWLRDALHWPQQRL